MGYCIYINPPTQALEDRSEHYNYFRDYDPAIGRYLESDPLGVRAGVNTYIYASRPLSTYDRFGLFTTDDSCKRCKYSGDIESDGKAWCDTVEYIVTDKSLAACIKEKCKKGRVTCIDPSGDCANNVDVQAYTWPGDNSIYLCTKNWKTGYGSGALIVHEFAHTCGWQHGGGFNVPINSGNFLNRKSFGPGPY